MKINNKKTILTGAFLLLALIVAMPTVAATAYNYSDTPGTTDTLIARTYSNTTMSWSATSVQDLIDSYPDGDFSFESVPDGNYKLYLAYWIDAMNAWGVGTSDVVTVQNGQVLESVSVKVYLVNSSDSDYPSTPAEQAWAMGFLNTVQNSTVYPSSGNGAISGTATTFDTANTIPMNACRGAAIGLWQLG